MTASSTAPLLEPGPDLTDQARARYARQLTLPGFDDSAQLAQRRLAAARVLLVGAGGLGSACAPYLVSSGVGTVGVCDDDDVELSNLHRQVVHRTADVGRPKVDSLADALVRLDPDVVVRRHHGRLTETNALELLAGYDLVVDGSDNFPTRYLVDNAAELAGVPLVWGAIGRFGGQVSVAWAERGPRYRDLFPAPPPSGSVLGCAGGGVLPGVCAVVGGMIASEVVKVITGVGVPLVGAVTVYDALTGRCETLPFDRSPDAPPAALGHGGPGSATSAAPGHRCVCTATATRPDELLAALAGPVPPVVLDVREPDERAVDPGLDGALIMPMSRFDPALLGVGASTPVVVCCSHGARSAAAVALLHDAGFTRATHLAGGLAALRRAAR